MEKIEWRDVVGFESHYEASNTGLIKRKFGKTLYKDGRVAYFSETVLKPSLCKKGYLRVYLSIGSKKHTKKIHRLIALTFIENPENKETVNHIDCNKLNNNVNNLEWMTNQENMRHAFDNGIYKDRDRIRTLYKNKKCN